MIHVSLVRMSEVTTLVGHEGWLEWKHLRDRLPALISKTGAQLPLASQVAALRPEELPDNEPDRRGDRRSMILRAIAEVEVAIAARD